MRHNTAVWRGLTLVVITAMCFLVGCAAPYPNAVINSNGQTIRLSDIDAILNDTTLNEDQKKQALQNLGITDEELLNVLLAQGQTT